MKKIFLPFSFILLLASCVGEAANENEVAEADSATSLTACECADIYANNPTVNQSNEGQDREALKDKWNEMWAPCEGIDMSEVLKCK